MFTEKLKDLSSKLTEEIDRRLQLQYEVDKVANLVTQVWLLAVVSSTVCLGRVMLTCCLWWVYSYERNECVSACEIQGSHSTEYEVCWDVTAFSLVDTYWHFGGTAASIFRVQARGSTLVSYYQTTRPHNREDCNIHNPSRCNVYWWPSAVPNESLAAIQLFQRVCVWPFSSAPHPPPALRLTQRPLLPCYV